MLKTWNQESSVVPVVTPIEPQQNNSPSVIRVVTNMGGGSSKSQCEPPRVLTVFSGCQTRNLNTASTKQYVLQTGGSFKQVSPKTDNRGQAMSGHSRVGEGIGAFREQSRSKPCSYTVYTISGNQLISSTPGERPPLLSDRDSSSRPPVTCSWTDNNASSASGVSQGHLATNAFIPLTPRNTYASGEPTR